MLKPAHDVAPADASPFAAISRLAAVNQLQFVRAAAQAVTLFSQAVALVLLQHQQFHLSQLKTLQRLQLKLLQLLQLRQLNLLQLLQSKLLQQLQQSLLQPRKPFRLSANRHSWFLTDHELSKQVAGMPPVFVRTL